MDEPNQGTNPRAGAESGKRSAARHTRSHTGEVACAQGTNGDFFTGTRLRSISTRNRDQAFEPFSGGRLDPDRLALHDGGGGARGLSCGGGGVAIGWTPLRPARPFSSSDRLHEIFPDLASAVNAS